MNIPDDLLYTKNDEWLKLDGETATVGVSDYAQDQLSDIVYVEVTASVGASLSQGDDFGTVESVKAASDIYMPVDGELLEINESLADTPEAINSEPYESWMIKVKLSDPAQAEALLDAAAYRQHIAERDA